LDNSTLTDKSFTGPGQFYVFWDSIHPTTKTHGLIAQAAFQTVGVQVALAEQGPNSSLLISHLSPTVSYTVQSSPDLVAWSDYQTITATTTNATVALTNGVSAAVFYRVKY
jgi:hypothetical protein